LKRNVCRYSKELVQQQQRLFVQVAAEAKAAAGAKAEAKAAEAAKQRQREDIKELLENAGEEEVAGKDGKHHKRRHRRSGDNATAGAIDPVDAFVAQVGLALFTTLFFSQNTNRIDDT
jgi:hypothetical protein